ncbi:MAG TPA: tRNA (cytidine(56)-2'-O)-methyltransferase [Candidatus Thermoplasmatota archaeon]|nr:tRNA (cytidine(56)-2'-O)-methyltransferase [Candidatus Thermoplasmatota archaeon]
MRIEVLRLGHRPERDKRVTTHVCLTARALGAVAVHIAETDEAIVRSVSSVAKRFGGPFAIDSGVGWKGTIGAWKKAGGQVVHLTMYGLPLAESVPHVLDDGRDVLIVLGAEKVPGDLYDLADHNVAVGNQPHSEVAALALLMDRLRGGAWEWDTFPGGSLRVVPTAHGKRVEGDGSVNEEEGPGEEG